MSGLSTGLPQGVGPLGYCVCELILPSPSYPRSSSSTLGSSNRAAAENLWREDTTYLPLFASPAFKSHKVVGCTSKR
jgi:hypothetical protein